MLSSVPSTLAKNQPPFYRVSSSQALFHHTRMQVLLTAFYTLEEFEVLHSLQFKDR